MKKSMFQGCVTFLEGTPPNANPTLRNSWPYFHVLSTGIVRSYGQGGIVGGVPLNSHDKEAFQS